jgi:hypothetical protein
MLPLVLLGFGLFLVASVVGAILLGLLLRRRRRSQVEVEVCYTAADARVPHSPRVPQHTFQTITIDPHKTVADLLQQLYKVPDIQDHSPSLAHLRLGDGRGQCFESDITIESFYREGQTLFLEFVDPTHAARPAIPNPHRMINGAALSVVPEGDGEDNSMTG